ncbi:She3p KNAG_0B01310 [Huiozyma naganishii CBS 8797]|uniref:SWI5-dependent HO expression protein 3 n=1 Tax=Huiozyma naganishii (strain ATCC MYA-139 / BCRC 22969 / CBS 8797 / KCTC 17520 / NBRC 10181 / NCYC 3082 / Yp74L-3) TaxID=1071383 RepID=J7RGB4_HUIN7|nr:hypothetical protein KNAG_0B01310 [Kazachstania naganishii CBS 8797]CCK68578.1 hypothetical protein KNAG_0B01310 [Kazachstania naganishii CBS 8797]
MGVTEGNGVPAASGEKLAAQYGIFMANLQGQGQGQSGTVAASSAGGEASGQVIDVLRARVDTLAETNVQLAMQSHSLLEKLEQAQENETRLLDGSLQLKQASDALHEELDGSTVELRQLESRAAELRAAVEEQRKRAATAVESSPLQQGDVAAWSEQAERAQAQYTALITSQQLYKDHYLARIKQLREELDSAVAAAAATDSLDTSSLQLSLREFTQDRESLDALHTALTETLGADFDAGLTTADWATLYTATRARLETLASEMGYTLAELLQGTATAMQQRQQQHQQHQHRHRNFFGASSPTLGAVPTSAGTAALPGVKRTSSLRKTSQESDTRRLNRTPTPRFQHSSIPSSSSK